MDKDLLGRRGRERKSRLQLVIEKYDRDTIPARLARLRWLQRVFPSGYGFAMPAETLFVFDEAKMAFLNGQFIATIMLAAAFLEHWLGILLNNRGFRKEAHGGLKSIIDCMRRNQLAHEYLLKKADRIRELRNPFAHLKAFDHPHTVTQRAILAKTHPFELMEADAREALSLMYQVATGKGVTT